jgi:hypothetical protein
MEQYAGRTVMGSEQANRRIKEMIQKGEPFVASRFGSVECTAISRREAMRIHRWIPNHDKTLVTTAGFFPYDTALIDQFAAFMLEKIPVVDLLGIWHPSMEEYLIANYMPNTELTGLGALEPYGFEEPWSELLEGKKVLVVHPFEKSIRCQYEKREKLFANKKILPAFELKTVKAVQTAAGEQDARFTNWFEAYDYMKEEMESTDYDIAIIGCGAYGMPLAIDAKRNGKMAIHLGGATQLLFGIKGARWDEGLGKTLYNDSWIRPLDEDRIAHAELVENGCYW